MILNKSKPPPHGESKHTTTKTTMLQQAHALQTSLPALSQQSTSSTSSLLLLPSKQQHQTTSSGQQTRSFNISPIKKTPSTNESLKDEWWQLFDTQSKRFYYYNAKRELTQWHRPSTTKSPSSSTKTKDDTATTTTATSTTTVLARSTSSSSSTASSGSSSIDNIDSDHELLADETSATTTTTSTNSENQSNGGGAVCCLLASRIVNLLIGQLNLEHETSFEELVEKIRTLLQATESNSDEYSRISKEIQLLDSLLALSNGSKDDFKRTFSSYLAGSCSLVTDLNSPKVAVKDKETKQMTAAAKNRMLQPRTNPNYINVNLVDRQNGSLLKNTYVKLQEIEDNTADTSSSKFVIKRLTNESSTSLADFSKIAVLLMALLNSQQHNDGGTSAVDSKTQIHGESSTSQNTISQPLLVNQKTAPSSIKTSTQTLNHVNNNKLHQHAKENGQQSAGKSLISCFMSTSDLEASSSSSKKIPSNQGKMSSSINEPSSYTITGPSSTSLTRKTIEKKFSFLSSNRETSTPKQHSVHFESGKNKSSNDLKCFSKEDSELKNSKTQAAVIAAAAAAAVAAAKSTPILDESITALETSSLDLLSDDNTTLSPNSPNNNNTTINNNKLLLNASVSSLADLQSSSQSQLNQKLKNLRRSFNNNTTCGGSVKVGNNSSASILSSSSSSQLDKTTIATGYMTVVDPDSLLSNEQQQQALSGDLLARKPSESNLLYIKTQIDLNVHHEKKLKSGLGGLLFFSSRKRIADHDLMVWTSQTIEKPLIKTNNKTIKKEACELFKLIQCYMGDRKSTSSTTATNTPENSLRLKPSKSSFISSQQQHGTSSSSSFIIMDHLNSQKDLTALEIMSKGWQHAQLRDELFLQLIKQTTSNLNRASCLLGWQLMALCLSFFPPTQKLYPFLGEYILAHMETSDNLEHDNTLGKLARACLRRLERIQVAGAKKGLKAPTIEEIVLSKSTILQASLFGTTLEEIMCMQRKKCPQLQLPWIQTVLSEAVLRLNGAKTEGIFRVPGDLDEVNNLKVRLDQLWCCEQVLSEHDGDIDLMQSIQDPHLPASLLKLWYRELHEPLIPNEYYDECISYCDQPEKCLNVIQKLPKINRVVFTYLIKFLKVFAASENVAITKMDANNLSMVMAPNCLRCKSNDPKIIMENTKKEMQFIKTLIQHLDTNNSMPLQTSLEI